jgi:hypothetical protein
MARPKRKITKQTRRRRRATSASTSASTSAPTINIKSPSDVKKALDIMKKFPLTVILVFASWCPHCHTYMKEWNKYKGLPNRTSPMVAVENNNSAELLKHLRGSQGEEVAVNAFPTVFVSKPGSNATNMVEPISTSERSSMITLLNKGSEAVSGSANNGSATEEPMSASASHNEESANDPSSANNYLSESESASASASASATNSQSEDASASNSPGNASNFTESIRTFSMTNTATNKANSAGITPFRRVPNLSGAVKKAVQNATARRRRVASASAAANTPGSSVSILPPINNRFAKPPRKEQPYNLTMGGGGGNGNCTTGTCGMPSGLIKLQNGGMSPNGSLYAMLRDYSAPATKTRKNYT